MQTIWLASQSPRRAELLQGMNVPFDVLTFLNDGGLRYEVDESVRAGELPHDYVQRVARDKAQYAARYLRQSGSALRPILTADTTVALGPQILGKPGNAVEASEMLERLSGKTHHVLTAVVLVDGANLYPVLSESRVRFMTLTPAMITAYVASGEPFDKAGGYGIQGRGGLFVADMQGSFTGIMGLPVHETACLLTHCGYQF